MTELNKKVRITNGEGVAIYGQTLDTKGRLGNFLVKSNLTGVSGPYATYSEAEDKAEYLRSVKNR